MTPEETLGKLKGLYAREKELQQQRAFMDLLDLYDEILAHTEQVENVTEALMKQSYCYDRVGMKTTAKQILEQIPKYLWHTDAKRMRIRSEILSLFLSSDSWQPDQFIINTLTAWRKDQNYGEEIDLIVFDHPSFLGEIERISPSLNDVRQDSFSTNLKQKVFQAMQQDEDSLMFYNRATNDVQQFLFGYLVSNTAEDELAELRNYQRRMRDNDVHDQVIEGVHFPIPRLELRTFIETFLQQALTSYKYVDLINGFSDHFIAESEEYENQLNDNPSDEPLTIDDFVLHHTVMQKFVEYADSWLLRNPREFDRFSEIISRTVETLAMAFLRKVNEVQR